MFDMISSGVSNLDSGASVTDFPYGKQKADDPAGSQNGTPLQIESNADCIQGMYAVLKSAGIVPNNQLDNVTNSQFRDALENLFSEVGDIKMRYSNSSPSNSWLLLDGSTFVQATYPLLYALLGNSNVLPDFSGRVAVAYDSGDVDFNGIGDANGEKEHILLDSEMPSHDHAYNDKYAQSAVGTGAPDGISDAYVEDARITGVTGGDAAHNNLQPYIVVGYFIKAK